MSQSEVKDPARAALLNLAIQVVKDGKYTREEAEKTFNIKIPGSMYPSQEDGFYIRGSKRWMPDYYGWAKYFIDTNRFFSTDSGYYIYDNNKKFYRRVSELELDCRLTADTKDRVEPSHRNHFIRTLAAKCFKMPDQMRKTEGFLNLQNGVLDIKSGEIKPHDSNLFFTYCLPHAYDPKAKCHRWMAFLNEIFKGDEELKMVAAQIFGYVLLGGHPWLHQAFVLYGEGRNGKSTFLDMLRELIGMDNFCTVSLARLDHSFSVVQLDGRLANIVEETPNDKINAEIFKTAIGGGLVMGAKKYENEYQFKCEARFIFACNDYPKFGENSVGLHERLYFIPFKRFFSKAERNGNILNELRAELPGILNWALNGVSILEDERRLPVLDASTAVMEDYKIESDGVYAWATEAVIEAVNVEFLSSKSAYDRYKKDSISSGRSPVSDMTFYKRIKKYIREKIPKAAEYRKAETKERGYRGLDLKP